MSIKFFSNFSFESEVYKIVYTPDNFNDWLSSNTNKDLGDFSKQIHNSLEGLDNIPDKEQFSQDSLDDYLSNFEVYKNDDIRKKVIKLILRKYKPNEIFKKKQDKQFDWTHFKHSYIKDGDQWIYKDITIIRPNTWQLFNELDINNMPENIDNRRKFNYKDFYGEKGFNFYNKIYGIAFYFVNYDSTGAEHDDSKTILFMIIPHQINFDLVPRIKYNSVLLHKTSYMDNIYVMCENKPDKDEIEAFIKQYDLENILLPLPMEENYIKRILKFNFKKKI